MGNDFIDAPKEAMENKKFELVVNDSVKFGLGSLMPMFLTDKVSTRLVISKTGEVSDMKEIVPKEKGFELAKTSEPMCCLEFPNNENGIQSLKSLREWLDVVETFISEEQK